MIFTTGPSHLATPACLCSILGSRGETLLAVTRRQQASVTGRESLHSQWLDIPKTSHHFLPHYNASVTFYSIPVASLTQKEGKMSPEANQVLETNLRTLLQQLVVRLGGRAFLKKTNHISNQTLSIWTRKP